VSAEERLIKRVIARFRCSHCNRQHVVENVDIMEKYDDAWVVGVACEGCEQPGMYIVSLRKDSSVDVVTDLTEEEMARFEASQKVAAEDVSAMKSFLDEFDGDFSQMFGRAS